MKPPINFLSAALVAVAIIMLPLEIGLASLLLLGAVYDRNSIFELHLISDGTQQAGVIIQHAGRAWLPQFNHNPGANSKLAYRSDRVIEADKNTVADAFADRAQVFYDPTTGNVHLTVAAAGAAGFLIGRAQGASSAGTANVRVEMNAVA